MDDKFIVKTTVFAPWDAKFIVKTTVFAPSGVKFIVKTTVFALIDAKSIVKTTVFARRALSCIGVKVKSWAAEAPRKHLYGGSFPPIFRGRPRKQLLSKRWVRGSHGKIPRNSPQGLYAFST